MVLMLVSLQCTPCSCTLGNVHPTKPPSSNQLMASNHFSVFAFLCFSIFVAVLMDCFVCFQLKNPTSHSAKHSLLLTGAARFFSCTCLMNGRKFLGLFQMKKYEEGQCKESKVDFCQFCDAANCKIVPVNFKSFPPGRLLGDSDASGRAKLVQRVLSQPETLALSSTTLFQPLHSQVIWDIFYLRNNVL